MANKKPQRGGKVNDVEQTYQLSIIFPSHVLKLTMTLSKNNIEKIEEVLSQKLVLRHLDKISGTIYSINTQNVLWFEFNALKSIE
ncbi:hypothetical protein EFK39_07590 [Lactococcus lactis subsp. lactis]|nr:hypothetical protein [Lactococcus lactis subsp. lactis]MCT0477919.1 hypothetical protein [Lactococcus cremoris]